MSAPTTRQKQARRLTQKSLRRQLCERFEHDYGFDKGRRIIPAIVDDILALVADYFGPDCNSQPTQIVYTAADANAKPTRGKTMAQTRQQAIRLTIIAPDDCRLYAEGVPLLQTARFVRWLHEAIAQGAALTSADLAFIGGVSCSTVEARLRQHEAATGKLLPLRGTLHDCSSKLTHKARIVQLYLHGQLPTEIARATDHSLDAVEHYLRDFELVRELAPKYDAQTISHLIQRGARVVQQYLHILAHNSPPNEKGDTSVREPSVSPPVRLPRACQQHDNTDRLGPQDPEVPGR